MNDLLQRAQRGDSEAFIELFEQCKIDLWKAALAVLGDTDDAADALQETTLKAWRAIPRFEGRSSVGTWLMRILLRTCFDLRRKRSHEIPYAMHGQEGAALEQTWGQLATDDARAIAGGKHVVDHDAGLDVCAAVENLSVDDRLVLTLAYVNDYSTKQIALVLGISEGAVRTRLTHRYM